MKPDVKILSYSLLLLMNVMGIECRAQNEACQDLIENQQVIAADDSISTTLAITELNVAESCIAESKPDVTDFIISDSELDITPELPEMPAMKDLYGNIDPYQGYGYSPKFGLFKEYKFTPKQLILPASLIALGAAGVSKQFSPLKNAVRDQFKDWSHGRRYTFDDHLQYTPVLGYLVMGLVGVPCKHRFLERFMVCATSYMSLGIMVNTVKYTVKELRPRTGRRNSFPSGHSATAFMGAELIRLEYSPGIAIAAYGWATIIGFMRMWNEMHWINDVIAGAGVGILSARIGYWMLPLYKKWFHWDNKKAITLMPGYDPETHTATIGLTATF